MAKLTYKQQLEEVIKSAKCDISRSWYCREGYSNPLLQEAMRAIEEALAPNLEKLSLAKQDVLAARRERNEALAQLSEVREILSRTQQYNEQLIAEVEAHRAKPHIEQLRAQSQEIARLRALLIAAKEEANQLRSRLYNYIE